MRIFFLAIGDELLKGESREGNGIALAEFLQKRGAALSEIRVLADDPELILHALGQVTDEPALVVVSGGLGPTDDDRTRDAVASACGVELVSDAHALSRLESWAKLRGRSLDPSNLRQAQFPSGSKVLENEAGTAPGFAVRLNRATVACFPGVPHEFRAMIHAHLPEQMEAIGVSTALARETTFRVFGITESGLQGLLKTIPGYARIHMRSLPSFPEIRLVLSSDDTPDELESFADRARQRLGWRVFSEDPTQPYAETVLRALDEGGATLAVAESCSGGLISEMLTRIPGASRSFLAGVVSYSNESKSEFLGVTQEILEKHGAVSAPTVEAMAEGVRRRCGASVGVSVTGIAGPDGGSAEKPVGTFFVGLATEQGTEAVAHSFPGLDRERFQSLVAYVALNAVRRYLASVHKEEN